ncbi:MAG: PEP-utilizing enzyme [Patescibacteria group bacterium]|jgi:phosphoenolpyruvate synthase/pyruvate phosphate dikinase
MNAQYKLYERDGVTFAALQPYFESMAKPMRGVEYHIAPRLAVALKGSHIYWAYGMPEYKNVGVKWVQKMITSGVNGRFYRVENKHYKNALAYFSLLISSTLPKNTEALIKVYTTIHDLAVEHCRIVGVGIDAFDDFFEEIVTREVSRQGYPNLVDDKDAWSKVLQPAYRSEVLNYKLAILELSKKIKNKKFLVSAQDVEHIYRKYYWLTIGWGGRGVLTRKKIKQETRACAKLTSIEYQQERKYILDYAKRIAENRRAVLKRFQVPEKVVRPYLTVLDKIARMHDQRKEIQMRSLFLMDEIRRKVARTYSLKMADLVWLKPNELRRVIRTGKIPKRTVIDRKSGYLVVMNGSKKLEKTGKQALRFIDNKLKLKNNNLTSVKGAPASAGIATGRAFVTEDPRRAIKFLKKGDILVTPMTTPDFVPAMKKAVAVVTNEGGVTVHAAIISRELRIPCVTGTEIATAVFKTGDRIEVNGNTGVVRKI